MYYSNREKLNNYCNYLNYSIRFFEENNQFFGEFTYLPYGVFCKKLEISFKKDGKIFNSCEFGQIKHENFDIDLLAINSANIKVSFLGGKNELTEAAVLFVVNEDGVEAKLIDTPDATVLFNGELDWGKSPCAITLDKKGDDIATSLGYATTKENNALFDRETDNALKITAQNSCRIKFDYQKNTFCFSAEGTIKASIKENVLKDKYKIKYKPINKMNTFPTPPAGWMTWYAVKFDVCEQDVLENSKKQKELFADYGANTVWVDWEWYHDAFKNENPKIDVHILSPDKDKYPNGLAVVAEKIKEDGFIPGLWIAPTVDPYVTDYAKSKEGLVLAEELTWCGKAFYDATNKTFLEEFLIKNIKNVLKWGYKAVKWDCLPFTLRIYDKYHDYFYDKTVTSDQSLYNAIAIGRKELGEDFYMMSCSGGNDRANLFAIDIFDGGRIGEDIFSWEEFYNNFIKRIMRFYPLHNNVFYCDPDNLVVRPEFNTFDQAITRASLFSLLGMPITLGDDLRELPMDRVDIVRRALPPLDARPMDIIKGDIDSNKAIVTLNISKPFDEWSVACVANLSENQINVKVDFDKDLKLDDGRYLVYDYWNKKFLGILDKELSVTLEPCACVVLSLHKFSGKKQIISTSRHISQGAVDLLEIYEDGGNLIGRSKVVGGEEYVITYYDPDTNSAKSKTFVPEKTGEINWTI